MNPDDKQLKEIYTLYQNITIIGLSHQKKRPSNHVGQYLLDNGYEIEAVRPAGPDLILGRPRYATIFDVPHKLEIVNVFRASEFVPQIVEDVLSIGASVLWLQEGIEHKEAEKKARDFNMVVVSNLCILKAHQRLFPKA